ncbi:MAG TPA: glycosyltransferase family 2 protein [Hanamia sp.]|nr:glycosyltransferase family 2 protein [Hanamia sp.]
MSLSIIIINYNVKYFLEQCLLSVIKAIKNIDGEIIVIDNNSGDDSFSFFQNRFPEVNFIWNKMNTGFAKANNQGLKIAKGEIILFLNPDTIIPEDCFEKCIAFIHKNNCALGIKMLDGAGNFLKESKRAFPSPLISFYKLAGFSRLFPHSKIFSKYHLGNLNENKNHEVDVLAGAFMMIPKNILDKTGGFDEDFFMYGEDIDLSFRIQKAGYANYYFAESSIIHFKGESTKKGSLNYVKMFYKAMSVFVKKHYGSSRSGLFSFFINAAIFFRASFSVISRLLERKRPQKPKEINGNNKIIVAGSSDEYIEVIHLLENAGMKEKILGRIETDDIKNADTIGSFVDFEKILQLSSVKEIIFCEGNLSFKKIIETMPEIPKNISIQLFSNGSHAIIGSNDKNVAGNFILKN